MIQKIRQELESYLCRYGWQYRIGSDDEVQTGWQGENRSYPLRIIVGSTWISFRVQPFLGLDIDWESWPEIATQVLEINDGTNMARLSIDEEGRLVLGMEIFTDDLNFTRLSNVLGIIGYYSDLIYEDILSVLDQAGFRYCESLNILT